MERQQAAGARHRAGPRLSLRLRHDAHADVPPGRRAGRRRGHQLREPEGGAARVHAASSSRRTWRCACVLRTSRSPSRPPKSTSRASRAAASGCRVCKNTGWLEVAGCGVVHPNVLRGGEHRSRALHRLRIRHGHRSADDAALQRQRPAPVLRERSALPRAVRLSTVDEDQSAMVARVGRHRQVTCAGWRTRSRWPASRSKASSAPAPPLAVSSSAK